MTTITTTNMRACDDCGQVTDYEPIAFGQWDLGEMLPHYCCTCAAGRLAAEEAATAARVRDKRESAWVAAIPK